MRVVLSAVLFLNAITPSWGDLHLTETKSLSKLIQLSARCSYLNPILSVLERHQSRYLNISNYAPGEKSAAPDPSELLVQGLFSVPPGTDNPLFLRTSPLSRKFGRFLSPTTVGKILAAIESSDPMANPGALKKSLKEAISRDDDFKSLTENSKMTAKAILARRDALVQRIKKTTEQIEEKTTELKTLQSKMKGPDCNEARFSQIKDLRSDIAAIAQRVANIKKQNELENELVELKEEYKKLTDQYNSHRYDPSFMSEFLDKLVKSLQSERNPSQGGRYPKYFTEQVLLTLALLNTPDHDKGHFLKLYRELPEYCFKEGKKPDLSGPFMEERFTQMDYKDVKDRLIKDSGKKHAAHLIQNPEEATLLRFGKRFFEPEDVPILPYKSVPLKHPSKGLISFPDCMESSLLNFFAIIGKDKTGLLSGTSLPAALNEKGYRLHEKIESFFNVYQDSASMDTLQAHEQWAALMSFSDGVHYKNEDYEIKSEIDNIFAVMEKLIQPNKDGMPPLFEGLSTRKEKMDRLCKVLSHGDLQLSWNIQGGNKTDLDTNNYARLLFTIENKPWFVWNVANGHSAMATIGDEGSFAEKFLGETFLGLLTPGDGNSLSYKLTALFFSNTEVPALAEKLKLEAKPKDSVFLRQGFRLSTVHEKLELASSMIGRDPHSIEWVKRLIGSIPRTDLSAQSFVMNFIMTHGLDQVEDFRKEFENAAQVLQAEPENAIRYSIENTLIGTIRYLTGQNFPFKFYNQELDNPLHIFAKRPSKNIEAIQLIASSHPDLLREQNLSKKTPLQEAVGLGNVPTVITLLDEMQSREIDLNTKDIHTLSFAIELGDIEMVKALADQQKITFKQAIEEFKYTPKNTTETKALNALSVIIKKKKATFLKYLFVNEKELFIELLSNEDERFGPPLKQLAKSIEGNSYSHKLFTEDLLEEFPEIFSVKERKSGTTLLHLIAEGKRAKTVKLALKSLGKKVNDASFLDHRGASPLHRAAASKDFTPATEEITTALAKANPNWVKLKDQDGKTPLDLAKTPEMVQLLKKLAGE